MKSYSTVASKLPILICNRQRTSSWRVSMRVRSIEWSMVQAIAIHTREAQVTTRLNMWVQAWILPSRCRTSSTSALQPSHRSLVRRRASATNWPKTSPSSLALPPITSSRRITPPPRTPALSCETKSISSTMANLAVNRHQHSNHHSTTRATLLLICFKAILRVKRFTLNPSQVAILVPRSALVRVVKMLVCTLVA